MTRWWWWYDREDHSYLRDAECWSSHIFWYFFCNWWKWTLGFLLVSFFSLGRLPRESAQPAGRFGCLIWRRQRRRAREKSSASLLTFPSFTELPDDVSFLPQWDLYHVEKRHLLHINRWHQSTAHRLLVKFSPTCLLTVWNRLWLIPHKYAFGMKTCHLHWGWKPGTSKLSVLFCQEVRHTASSSAWQPFICCLTTM